MNEKKIFLVKTQGGNFFYDFPTHTEMLTRITNKVELTSEELSHIEMLIKKHIIELGQQINGELIEGMETESDRNEWKNWKIFYEALLKKLSEVV